MKNCYYASTAVTNVNISAAAYKVFVCLQEFADYKTRVCWPKYKTIAGRCGFTVRQAMRAVKELCTAGLLERKAQFEQSSSGGRRQKENLYTIIDCPQMTLCKAADGDKRKADKHNAVKLYKAQKAEIAKISASALKVYNYINLKAGRTGSCSLTKKALSAGSGVSEITVYRAIKQLKTCGLLSVDYKTRAAADGSNGSSGNIYTLIRKAKLSEKVLFKFLLVALINQNLYFAPVSYPNIYVMGGGIKNVTPRTQVKKNNSNRKKIKKENFKLLNVLDRTQFIKMGKNCLGELTAVTDHSLFLSHIHSSCLLE